jgi:flagellar protein FlgJ
MRQLERQMGLSPGPIRGTGIGQQHAGTAVGQTAPLRIPQTGAAGFVQQHTTRRGGRGRHRHPGQPSWWRRPRTRPAGVARRSARRRLARFNLFGIKAGATGRAGGRGHHHRVHQRQGAQGGGKFRAYASYEESFADYARLMKDSPRYARWWRVPTTPKQFRPGPAAGRLRHRPGLCRQADRVINTTLRLQRTLA